VKITDFGDAKKSNVTRIEPSLGKSCFTPLYFSPEILNAKKLKNYYSFPCDIWSLGIVLYIIIYEKAPFNCTNDHPNSKKMREKIRNGDFVIDKNEPISEDLLRLLKRMLTTTPEMRIKIKEILKNKMFKFSSNEL
jgi:serine/threonine protein kinase